jgi:hypothetical protein
MNNSQSDRVRRTRTHIDFYREYGWNVLPSELTKKKPLIRFAEYWEKPLPEDVFDRFPLCNLQIMTGVHWRLAVLDLDGREAIEHVEREWRKLPRTWTVFHSNGGRESRHHWFTLPEGLEPKGKQVLHAVWDEEKATWKKHTAVELMLDRCLITGPCSTHIKTGREYKFTFKPGRTNIAELPEWIWRMDAVRSPVVPVVEDDQRIPIAKPSSKSFPTVTTQQVLDAIPDKVAVARSWRLRVTNNPGTDGWLQTHDFNREDVNPSAAFHAESGRFWRPGMHPTMSLFDLSVELGIYRDWRECKDALAAQYL